MEARWYHNGYAPTLEEYLENAQVSIAGIISLSNAYCINDSVTAKDLEQFSSGYPDIVRYSSMIFRLYNDLATSTVSAYIKIIWIEQGNNYEFYVVAYTSEEIFENNFLALRITILISGRDGAGGYRQICSMLYA